MTATEECAVDSRIADLIKRYGYDAVRASVQKQEPPPKPRRPGPKKPRYPIERDLPWLIKTKEDWEGAGKPVNRVWPHLMKVGEEMESKVRPRVAAKSHVKRLARRLEDTDEIWLRDHQLMEMAKACGNGHWFPFVPLPDQLTQRHRHDLIRLQNALCRFLIGKASLLPSARLDEEISDLIDIVRRRENWKAMAEQY